MLKSEIWIMISESVVPLLASLSVLSILLLSLLLLSLSVLSLFVLSLLLLSLLLLSLFVKLWNLISDFRNLNSELYRYASRTPIKLWKFEGLRVWKLENLRCANSLGHLAFAITFRVCGYNACKFQDSLPAWASPWPFCHANAHAPGASALIWLESVLLLRGYL